MTSIFNPSDLISEAIKAGFDPGVVSEIDERQLPWAKNVVSWVMDAEFLNIKTPYPLQLQNMLRLFGDVCAYCSDWEFYSRDFESDLQLSDLMNRIQLLEDGVCPKCKKTRLDQYHDNLWSFPNELNLLWGMRSGKSACAGGMIGTYVLHRYLRLPDPAVHFGLLSGQELYMRFVALTLKQAKQSNWMHFTTRVQSADWFRQYHDFINYFSRKKGIELVKWGSESFVYVHKGIAGYPVGAGTESTEKGRTSIFTSIDEIGMMNDDDKDAKKYNPAEIYAAYEKASATVRPVATQLFLKGDVNTPTAWMAVHSSTKSKTDYIMRLIKEGKSDKKKVISHKATWEVNPSLKFDCDELVSERNKDPKIFMRDYGSIPPFATDPFIDSMELVLQTAVLDPHFWPVKLEESKVGLYLSAENVEKNKSIPMCLSIDMGRSDCGYAVSLLKLKEEDFSVVQLAGLWSIYPKKPQVVDLDGMFNNFIKVMCEKLNIRLVVYDQWQSSAQIDALLKMDVKALQYSLIYKDFLQFRSNVFQNKLETVKPEMPFADVERSSRPVDEILESRPALHLLWQMLSVSETGQKVTKGAGHDDLFRAVVLGSSFLWSDKYRHEFEYKGGMALHKGGNRGGLVMAGGSRSGGTYNHSNVTAQNVVSSNGRVLGAFVGRTRR